MVARLAFLALCAAVALSTGASCFPLVELGGLAPDVRGEPTELALSVIRPASTREVASGTVIGVRWTASNLTGDEAVATVLIRDRSDLSETIIAGGVRVPESGVQRDMDWETADVDAGRYSIVVRLVAGAETVEETAPGQITVNEPATFEFTDPAADVVLEANEPAAPNDPNDPNAATPEPETPTVAIRWSAGDFEGAGSFAVGVELDTEPNSGDEIELTTGDLPSEVSFDAFVWDGTAEGAAVDPGRYNVFARVDDGVNPVRIVRAPGRITVPEPEPNEPNDPNGPNDPNTPPAATAFAAPNDPNNPDTEFLVGGDALEVKLEFAEPNDILIDLKVDVDENPRNANEITFVSQRLIDKDTNRETVAFEGTDTNDNDIKAGIYQMLMVVNRGTDNPSILNATGLFFIRDNADQPLIAMLEPASDLERDPGQFYTFQWRDDDPTEEAVIRLVLDDDPAPNQEFESGFPEIEILADREASPDGVQDTFAYQIPNTLTPDTYYVFAYIDEDGVAPFDYISVAAGRLTVKDPDE